MSNEHHLNFDSERLSGSGQTTPLKISDIEFRFNFREEPSNLLLESVSEHGILVPPIILQLTPELQQKFRTDKRFLCIDGHSRLLGLPEDAEVECSVITWDDLLNTCKKILKKIGLSPSDFLESELISTYILRLHSCREPLPRSAYISVARQLQQRGLRIRDIAELLGIPKSTLHDWLKTPKEYDLPASRGRDSFKQCALCGNWIKMGATPLWFHTECFDKVIPIIKRAKAKDGLEVPPQEADEGDE